jgi:hypothetical protein
VSSASVSGGSSASKRPLVAILAAVGIVAIIVGVLYMVAGSSLPSFMVAGSHVHKGGGHYIRGAVSLVVGLALLGGAWLSGRKK